MTVRNGYPRPETQATFEKHERSIKRFAKEPNFDKEKGVRNTLRGSREYIGLKGSTIG